LIAADVRLRAVRTLHPHASCSRYDQNVARRRLRFR
jgi:hypothetical protein